MPGDVGEEETALDHVSTATADAPAAQEECAGDGDANENSILAVHVRECADPPQKVDRA